MKNAIAVLISACCLHGAPPPLRTACVSVSELPQVTAALDTSSPDLKPPDLKANDFALFNGATRQAGGKELIKFGDTGVGVALIVALDASGSMKGRPLQAIQRGLADLVDRKRDHDKIAILSFADETRWESKWDASRDSIKASLRGLQGRGRFTRLYDALAFAIDQFQTAGENAPALPPRRDILIISDGHDEGSHTTLSQLNDKIANSRVRIDSVGLGRTSAWFGSLRQMSQTGFGGFRVAHNPDDLESLLSHGIDSLLAMPAVRFETSDLRNDGAQHTLAVVYTPTSRRDQFPVTFSQPFYGRNGFILWSAAGLFAVILAIIGLLSSRKKRPALKLEPAPVPAKSEPRPTRAATIAESAPTVAPAIRYSVATAAAGGAATAARATVLAPNLQRSVAKLALCATEGPYAGQKFQIDAGEFWIGSAPNNHLCLSADECVSGNHACIRTEEPFFRLYDHGSLNGTWLNGRAIGQEVALIGPGDRLRIGQSEFAIEASRDA